MNCRIGLDRKIGALRSLGCAVVVVPECAQTANLGSDPEVSAAWKGEKPNKGLGVFAFGGWTVNPDLTVAPMDWLLPLTAIDPTGAEVFTLLALWTVKRAGDGRPSYASHWHRSSKPTSNSSPLSG